MSRLIASTCSMLPGPIRIVTMTMSAAPSATSARVRMPADFPRSSRSRPMPQPIRVAMSRRSATSSVPVTPAMITPLHLCRGSSLREQSRQPQVGQFLEHGVLAETGAQVDEIDFVELLILIEAGKDERLLAADGVDMSLQALR